MPNEDSLAVLQHKPYPCRQDLLGCRCAIYTCLARELQCTC